MAAKVTAIAFDGDDTLWHNERFFTVTQERFANLLLPYAGEGVLERLHATEMRNLRLFGYGIKGFTLSMIETAIEASNGEARSSDIKTVLQWGKEMLQNPIELLEGVKEAIESLRERYRLMLITKGDLFDQESKIARSGLADLFWQVDIVSEKDLETYRRLLSRHAITPDEWLMVGNSVRSDILPAVEIGARAVHIPYHTTWVHEHAELNEATQGKVWTIESMADLPGLVESLT
ncbi:MAG TPA: haloacid dehalogenase [Chloroflexi bacterium]|jgi:putative hydrolase of the HAD superfamily|nr:haloacid dehalogenase [Chloroflexota bacterium]